MTTDGMTFFTYPSNWQRMANLEKAELSSVGWKSYQKDKLGDNHEFVSLTEALRTFVDEVNNEE